MSSQRSIFVHLLKITDASIRYTVGHIHICTHFAILKCSLTQGLKQILSGQTERITSTKRFEYLVKQLLQSLEHEVSLISTFPQLTIKIYHIEPPILV